MSRWRPSLVSLQPGMVWPGLVTRQQVFLAAKTAIAAGLAWVAALAADPHSRPYFAPLAVLLVVQPTVYDSLSRAFQRVAGIVVGVAAALAVSQFLAPSAWSIGIIIFAGLLAGWTARLGPQGAVQVPVSALLVFLIGRATPGYGGERIVETLIGAGVAVIAVLLSPSAPGPDAVMSRALAPLRRCTEILRAVSTGIGSPWTPDQAASWRLDALTLVDTIATARREYQSDRLSTRWNARARRERAALGRADEALLSGERIAIYRVLARCSRRRHRQPSTPRTPRACAIRWPCSTPHTAHVLRDVRTPASPADRVSCLGTDGLRELQAGVTGPRRQRRSRRPTRRR